MGNHIILMVEDEPLIQFIMGEALREAGYIILEAGDGEEALSILQSEDAVDLMVTDVRMPGGIDGLELVRRSKALSPGRPVIECSGHLLADEAGPADAFLSKPYTARLLMAAIERLLDAPRAEILPIRIN
ncbi:response regulator [Sphingopyxis sp. R3-92]|uniref:response regulator n=1 Tax=Sphingopyxis sp. R3-92 TaxID=3158553 RepID=UPI003EE74612